MIATKCLSCGRAMQLRGVGERHRRLLLSVCSEECLREFLRPPLRIIPRTTPSFFRSELERRFAGWMKDNKIPFLYEPFFIEGEHRYVPDFYIPLVGFIEIKGLPLRMFKVASMSKKIDMVWYLPQNFLDKLIGRSNG